jgi:hypothetical protein
MNLMGMTILILVAWSLHCAVVYHKMTLAFMLDDRPGRPMLRRYMLNLWLYGSVATLSVGLLAVAGKVI